MSVVVVNFSGRERGNCGAVARLLEQELEQVRVIGFSGINIMPCSRCNYECFADRELCPHSKDDARDVCQAITESDMAYFIVPNYCDYPCSNFFALNERSQCWFQGHEELLEQYLSVPKRFIVISGRETENFKVAFSYHVPEGTEPDILFLSAKKYGRRSVDGDLMEVCGAAEDVRQFIKPPL